MKINFMLIIIIISLFTIPRCLLSGDDKQTVDMDELAKKLVNQCAGIQEKDIVWISGGPNNIVLLEDLAIHIQKLGAYPLITLSSDRLNRRYFDEVDPKYDSYSPELDLKLANMIDAQISVSYGEDPGLLADVLPERFANLSEAYNPVNKIIQDRKVRGVYLGNGLYPTKNRAKLFDVPVEKLSKVFWDGVNTDYNKLKDICQKYHSALAGGKEICITNPNGTDFKVGIAKRPVLVSNGVIEKSGLEKGEASNQVWLPAGEVFLAPVPGTAEGKIIVDRDFYFGEEIKNIELTFEGGKLISMTAEAGLEPIKKRYDVSGKGKDEFAFVDIGLNPNVEIIPGSKMVAWMASGMVTIGIGGNTWAGGDNETNFEMEFFIPGSTLEVDGKVLVKGGKLNL